MHQTQRRKRCNALLRHPWTKAPDGRFKLRNPRCQAWGMANGRCRFHGGLATGPRSPEGKARVVAAMIAGRRAWVERIHDEGGTFKSGRKTGAGWVTELMRERARKLVLALLRISNGCPEASERANELLRAVAMLRAASPSPCYVGLIAMAEQSLRERRALGRGVGGQGVSQVR
jgi:hypothetical protein